MCMTGMTLEPFRQRHVPDFLSAAADEGWIYDPWEFRFLLDNFPLGCWVACSHDRPVGFVTAACYGSSGWIGNLLVREEMRGNGVGRELFRRSLGALDDAGVGTVWLTASPDGEPLYGKLGFAPVDRIARWRRSGMSVAPFRQCLTGYFLADMEETDARGWGDRRSSLLSVVAQRGHVVQEPGGFCILQQTGGYVQVGPWGCVKPDAAARLLLQAVAAAPSSTDIVLDAPESNEHGMMLLGGNGFVARGRTTLMCRGRRPAYTSRNIYALASLGSMG